jgi:hypothetical protein
MALKTERSLIWRTPIDNSQLSMTEPFYHPYLSPPYEYSRINSLPRDSSLSPTLSQNSILSVNSLSDSSRIPTIYTSQQILPIPQVPTPSYSNAIGYSSVPGFYDNGYVSPPSSLSPPTTPVLQDLSFQCVSECYCCQLLQWQVQQVIKQNHHHHSSKLYNEFEQIIS